MKDKGEYSFSTCEIINHAPVKVYELKAQCLPEEIEESHVQIVNKIAQLRG